WSSGYDYMIVSLGADGRPDYEYGDHEVPYEGISLGINSSDDQDIILIHDTLLRGPLSSRNSVRRTMADLRSIGTACEEYAIDNNFYPGSTGTVVPASSLVSQLTPTYIKILPARDGWGQPFLYWS